LRPRLDAVLQAIYLLFNEGYKASHGDDLVRRELSDEAIHLCRLLQNHPAGKSPSTSALLALMLLHAARFPARMDDQGNLLLLKTQDRSRWDKQMIVEGLKHLDASAEGEQLTEYHLQAGIAACHCLALDYEQTDWSRILLLYNMLVEVNDSPIVLLNRAVAISKVKGPEAGINDIEEIRAHNQLADYYLLYAALGELYYEMENFKEAASQFRKALQLTSVRTEQQFLQKKLDDLSNVNMN
jgi:RNA polymerase sigma-70 factor (ECF subfamily)